MFAYEFSFSELVQAFEFALVDCKTRWPHKWCFSFDTIVSMSNVECSDIGDRRRCSKAMQVLRKKWLCSYGKKHREWMIHSRVRS